MAITSTVKYLGNLRNELTHLASGATIQTDAPVDNKGKGEAFAPTDLCATSFAACAMTIMGIYGQEHNVDVDGMTAEVTKVMSKELPRRIAEITIVITMPDREYTAKEKTSLEIAANTCPVKHSLSPEVKSNLQIKWVK